MNLSPLSSSRVEIRSTRHKNDKKRRGFHPTNDLFCSSLIIILLNNSSLKRIFLEIKGQTNFWLPSLRAHSEKVLAPYNRKRKRGRKMCSIVLRRDSGFFSGFSRKRGKKWRRKWKVKSKCESATPPPSHGFSRYRRRKRRFQSREFFGGHKNSDRGS